MINNLIKVIILFGCSVSLTGCISSLLYDDATDYKGTDYARMRVSNAYEVWTTQAQEVGGCVDYSQTKIMSSGGVMAAFGGGGDKRIEGMPSRNSYDRDKRRMEYVVKSNVFTIIRSNPGDRFGGTLRFIPIEKHDYEITYNEIYDLTDNKKIESLDGKGYSICK